MGKKTCKTCGFLNPTQPVCQVFGHQVDPTADFCSKHNNQIIYCVRCGRPVIDSFLIEVKENQYEHFCDDCRLSFSTCTNCVKANICDFETNPSTLPKVVQKQIRQGNMIMMTQIRNPERIAITCQNGCPCFDAEKGCLKQFNMKCEAYDEVYNH